MLHILFEVQSHISKPDECKALTWQAWMSASITNLSSHNYVPGEQAMTGMKADDKETMPNYRPETWFPW